jgi:dinuclear metal center YbgI/SA1388 family protein
MKLHELLERLDTIAPLETAESWDNVGLLLGDRSAEIHSVMTCLTITSAVLQEAIETQVDMIVTHHPIPFKPLHRITSETSTGRILLEAAAHRIAIYSPHTAWDSAARGINQQLAERLNLQGIEPLKPFVNPKQEGTGVGRMGAFGKPTSVDEIRQLLSPLSSDLQLRSTPVPQSIRSIGIICGSGGSMLGLVASRGCDAMLTGEATYHQCLEAEALGICLIQIGHHASEAFSMRQLADHLARELPTLMMSYATKDISPF